ncbi:hypothetical protein GCM10022234_24680 [Aeromicrobium panaciterrae]
MVDEILHDESDALTVRSPEAASSDAQAVRLRAANVMAPTTGRENFMERIPFGSGLADSKASLTIVRDA